MTIEVVGISSLNYDQFYLVDSIATGDQQQVILQTHSEAGGSAANTIYGLAKLGMDTGFIGAVGSDAEGQEILTQMRETGIDISRIRTLSSEATSKILIFVDYTGERAMYTLPGANISFKVDEQDLAFLRSSSYAIFSAIPLFYESALDRLIEIVKAIHQDTKIVFMPGAIYTNLGFDKLKDILTRSYLVILNRREVSALTGTNLEPIEGAKWLLEQGCEIVVVTLGKNGCVVCDDNNDYEIPVPKLEANKLMDSTGAGDAFTAGFIFGLAKKQKNIKEAAVYGNLSARFCVQGLGARSGLASKEKLELEFEKYS